MQASQPKRHNAFTSSYPQKARVLRNKVRIGLPFEPSPDDNPKSIQEYDAIWDTGATHSVITQKVVDDCNLKPIGMAKTHGVHGEALVDTYLVSLILPSNVVITSITVSKGQFIGADVLIGMDIIGAGDFAVTNNGRTIFTFRLPSQGGIDFVKDIKRIANAPTVGRNDPCSCGSGKKYKRCCGK